MMQLIVQLDSLEVAVHFVKSALETVSPKVKEFLDKFTLENLQIGFQNLFVRLVRPIEFLKDFVHLVEEKDRKIVFEWLDIHFLTLSKYGDVHSNLTYARSLFQIISIMHDDEMTTKLIRAILQQSSMIVLQQVLNELADKADDHMVPYLIQMIFYCFEVIKVYDDETLTINPRIYRNCGCKDCKSFIEFLGDKNQRSFKLTAITDRRAHLQEQFAGERLSWNTVADEFPATLVVSKNWSFNNSYT
eukprot:TRINITY_DN2455_c0_g2_i1.p1 TRINITY_DN2455_c0_g2~~TRINITY_DN2455_c0_g2_i1.p1  ORF type:complete len:275 (+),score=37.82 TRINITY_DN2455_c0_g2_i1:89-826(+)